jgi:hypothetical protein
MSDLPTFDDLPVLGELPFDQAAAKLRALGESEAAAALEEAAAAESVRFGAGAKRLWPSKKPRAWQHTAHAFGHIAPAPPGDDPLPIRHAGNIAADEGLKRGRVKITLDGLRVADYPGGGEHHVLFDFYGRNQVKGGAEHLHFNLTCQAREGERAAILNYPIFVGLNVGSEGVDFKGLVVNLHNEDDQKLLGFLESDAFKAGLQLAATVQPAIGPLSGMALGLTRSLVDHRRNVAVQRFHLGLDFSRVVTGARLCEGSYVAVQIPETYATVWDWREWVYHPHYGQIVRRDDQRQLIPYNYIVIGVSRYEGA